MPARPAVVAAVCAAILAGCTSPASGPTDDGSVTPSGAATASERATGPSTPTPTPGQTTTPSPAATTEEAVLGTGTVTVDGTEMDVSGDCDLSREFGTKPVRSLDDEVDVLLLVDNLTGDGGHDGPFALQVRLLGRGELVGRELVSEGGPGEDAGDTRGATYEGAIEVAELQDRREREFVDVATLHLEASQRRTQGEGPSRRDLVVDVTCPISRPGT